MFVERSCRQMEYQVSLLGDEKFDLAELAERGRELAEEICLPEYLTRHRIPPRVAAKIWRHIGYVSALGGNSRASYETLEQIGADFRLRRGQLVSLVRVATRADCDGISPGTSSFIQKQKKRDRPDLGSCV